MDELLAFVERIFECDTEGVEPYNPHKKVNVFRPDIIRPSLSQEEALRNAPLTENGFFKVVSPDG